MDIRSYIRAHKKWVLAILVGWIFFVALFILKPNAFFYSSTTLNVERILKTLPEEDKTALEVFFYSLSEASFPYVLFGNKPMAICSFSETPSFQDLLGVYQIKDLMDFFFSSMNIRNLRIQRGWNIWKKYEHLFPSSNYVLLENRFHNWTTIILINKYHFLKVIEENIEDFKKVLGNQATPQEILKQCLKGDAVFKDILNHHDGLLGIVLGYGKHNAQLFFRRAQIEGVRDFEKFSLAKNIIVPSEGFQTLDEEYNYVCKKLTFFDKGDIPDFNPLCLTLPGFMADQDAPETHRLKHEYMKQYKNIIKKYQEGDYLEVTIRQLTQH